MFCGLRSLANRQQVYPEPDKLSVDTEKALNSIRAMMTQKAEAPPHNHVRETIFKGKRCQQTFNAHTQEWGELICEDL